MPSLARVGVCAGWAELPTHARGDTPAHEELGRKNYQGGQNVATAAGGAVGASCASRPLTPQRATSGACCTASSRRELWFPGGERCTASSRW